jgi:hypothetical protein
MERANEKSVELNSHLADAELDSVSGGMWYMYVVQAAVIMGSLGGQHYKQGVKDLS